VAGILFVVALVAEVVVAGSIQANLNDSAAKIAAALDAHRTQLLVIAGVCVVYAAMFPIYLWKLYDVLRGEADRSQALASLVLVGGALFVVLHAVSDIAITGLVGAKLATYGAQHDHGLSYSLYLLTFAVSSVGDIFGSLFMLAAGLLSMRSGVLPRWLGWVAAIAAIALFLQSFGLGGVIATFGLVFDLIGFVLLLVFVLISSIILLRREKSVGDAVQVR
jgi:hypothetical protein